MTRPASTPSNSVFKKTTQEHPSFLQHLREKTEKAKLRQLRDGVPPLQPSCLLSPLASSGTDRKRDRKPVTHNRRRALDDIIFPPNSLEMRHFRGREGTHGTNCEQGHPRRPTQATNDELTLLIKSTTKTVQPSSAKSPRQPAALKIQKRTCKFNSSP
jgi:hypothetical protein